MVGRQGFVHYWELFHYWGVHYSESILYLKYEMLFIQVRPSTRQETERPNGYLHRVRQLRDIEDRRPGFHGGNQRIPHRQMERQSGDNQ